MSLDKILAIEGKPGLYKLVTQTRSGFVAESLADGKKLTVGIHSNVSLLSDIAIFTLEKEMPLMEVFQKIQEVETGGKTSVGPKAVRTELEEYFFKVIPNYDEDRVYPGDIKKVIKWYNLLIEQGVTEFKVDSEENETESGE